jgi:hypothetical protein
MPTIFILDAPEFEPIVSTARHAGMDVRPVGDYIQVSSLAPRVTLERRHTGVRPAVWFAALTGGLVGRIERFDDDQLSIADDA